MRSEDAARPRMAARHKLWCAIALSAVAAVGGVCVQSVRAQSACMYEVIAEMKNPTCQRGSGNGTITALNDHNVVVGNFAINCGFDQQPFMWTAETGLVVIPLPPDTLEARAMDVNNNNEIVGWLVRVVQSSFQTVAFHWKDGAWTELPSLPGFPVTRAFAISDSGMIVGEAFDTFSADPFQAVRWIDGKLEEIHFSDDPQSSAGAINNQSFVAGWAGASASLDSDAFLLADETIVEIGRLPGTTSSEPAAVNNQNIVTGEGRVPVKTGSVPRRSWIFDEGQLTDLGTLPEADHRINSQDINDAGQIVGRSTEKNGPSRPFLWQHGEMFDLELLIVNAPPGKNLSTAAAINDNGWIAVDGVLLRPVDRPLGDVNIDCIVDERDLIAVLDDWGPDKLNHPSDMVTSATFQPPGDGVVDGADLAVVLGNWNASSSLTPRR